MKKYLLAVALLALTACNNEGGTGSFSFFTDEPTTTTQPPPPPPPPVPLTDKAKRASVHVIIKKGARGSGVYIGGDLILTAAHVCKSIQKKSVSIVTTETKITVPIVAYAMDGRWPSVDLCVLKMKAVPAGLVALPIAKTDAQIGEVVVLGSYAGGQFYSFRAGQVLAEETVMMELPFLVTATDLFVMPGASGGGVLNTNGEIVGVMILSNMQSMGAFEPVSDIRQFINEQLGLPL